MPLITIFTEGIFNREIGFIMRKYSCNSLIAFCSILVILGACNVAKPYKAPNDVSPNLYRNAGNADTTNMGYLPYSEVFTDTILQGLIEKGIERNLDLQIAYTRVQQAEAYYLQTGAALLPTLNSNAGVTVSKLSEAQGFGIRTSATQYQLGLSSSWEADVWGRLRSNRRANLANFLQTEAAAKAVQTGLVSAIATYYYTLLALDQQLIITQQTVYNWDTTVNTIKELKKAARVTEAAVVQSEAQRYAAEITIPDLKQRILETENALSILLGNDPAAIKRGNLSEQQTLSILQTGVPVQLLANRPDVQQAELQFRSNFELTNVAHASFYPALSITASTGLSAFNFANFLSASGFAASIGAGLTQPIFNQRINRTRLAVAEAQQHGSLLNFQNTLLNAGREVSNAVSLHQTAMDKMLVRTSLLNALQKSVDYSQELLRYGFANYTEVINARQSLLQAVLGGVNDRLQQLQALVNLYRALGGGSR
ncbi:MAG: efflux transporter outer membrane subunit [Chitinophagaceae bacterium]|nr:efflux transporter outer membrane subunit [Chitinophagaceae bacterium]